MIFLWIPKLPPKYPEGGGKVFRCEGNRIYKKYVFYIHIALFCLVKRNFRQHFFCCKYQTHLRSTTTHNFLPFSSTSTFCVDIFYGQSPALCKRNNEKNVAHNPIVAMQLFNKVIISNFRFSQKM